MAFVLDASIAAAWFLPDEQHDAADRLMSEIRSTVGLVPALFWFETRNLFLVAERRGRLKQGEPLLLRHSCEGCR
ncbi:type II toxin-antitoxin system VapC family toxin [Pararhizobium polonicum]|uniref:type II toxin-antitoxin system VapC family toxin n=1 Tax=Pararhizobium polonicum TaxID=1612624 RepID=UPI000ACB6076